MTKWILIAAGGAFGSIMRFALHGLVHRATTTEFPLGTLAVNVTGCLLIGFLGALFAGPMPLREEYRLGLIVGVLGGFTTFSAFGWDTFALLEANRFVAAALNVGLSCGAGLIAVYFGFHAAKQLFGA